MSSLARVIVCKMGRFGELRKLVDCSLGEITDQQGTREARETRETRESRESNQTAGKGSLAWPSLPSGLLPFNTNFEDGMVWEETGTGEEESGELRRLLLQRQARLYLTDPRYPT